jgi:DNA-directed RNA polymerase specialized sigma24 family protein
MPRPRRRRAAGTTRGRRRRTAPGDPTSMTDYAEENARAAELVRRAGAGDRSAEGELYFLYDLRLRVKLRQDVRGPAVNDVRQEVWIRVIEALRKNAVHQPEHFYGFLLGTARHVIQEHRRNQCRLTAIDPEFLDRVVDTGLALDDVVYCEQQWTHLSRCLERLSEPRDRDILVGHYRGSGKATLCVKWKLTSEHYNRVLHRARVRLARLVLDPDDPMPPQTPSPRKPPHGGGGGPVLVYPAPTGGRAR